MKKTIMIILLLAAAVGGCKKYEEGPCISFRSAENRVMGYYDLTELTADGVDELDLYYDSLGKTFEFLKRDPSTKICRMYGNRKDGGGSNLYWIWRLYDEEKILKVEGTGGSLPGVSWGPFKTFAKPEWEILRLTNRELKMKTTYNDKEYVVDLEKK